MKTASVRDWQNKLAAGHTETWLKTAIVLIALAFIFLAVFVVNNRWVLAGMFLYLILP